MVAVALCVAIDGVAWHVMFLLSGQPVDWIEVPAHFFLLAYKYVGRRQDPSRHNRRMGKHVQASAESARQ